jgi:hypothetical protein
MASAGKKVAAASLEAYLYRVDIRARRTTHGSCSLPCLFMRLKKESLKVQGSGSAASGGNPSLSTNRSSTRPQRIRRVAGVFPAPFSRTIEGRSSAQRPFSRTLGGYFWRRSRRCHSAFKRSTTPCRQNLAMTACFAARGPRGALRCPIGHCGGRALSISSSNSACSELRQCLGCRGNLRGHRPDAAPCAVKRNTNGQ